MDRRLVTTISHTIALFMEHREGTGASQKTLSLYRRVVTRWQKWQNKETNSDLIADIGIEHFRAYIAHLQTSTLYGGSRPSMQDARYTENTIDSHYRILRTYWNFCDNEELLTPTQARFFRRGRIARPKIPKRIRPAADNALVDQLVSVLDDDDSERAALIRVAILLLFETGLRISELCSLTDNDLNITEKAAKVIGKGNNERWVFWQDQGNAALIRYLRCRRGPIGGPLLRGCSHRNNGGALTDDALRAMLKRHANEQGLSLPKGAPAHCFRHGFVHSALEAGVDIAKVSQLAGHSSINTTMIYAQQNKSELQYEHQKLAQVQHKKHRKNG